MKQMSVKPYAFVKGAGKLLAFVADYWDRPWADVPWDVDVRIADNTESVFPSIRKAQEMAAKYEKKRIGRS